MLVLQLGELFFARLLLLRALGLVLLPLARGLFFARLSLLCLLGFERSELLLLLLLFACMLRPHRGELGLMFLLLARVFGLRRGKLGFALLLPLRLRGFLLRAPLFFTLLFFALRLPLRLRRSLSGELGLARLLLRLGGRLLLELSLLALLFLGLSSLGRALTFDLLGLVAFTFGFLSCQLLSRACQLGLLPFALTPLSGAFTARLRVHGSS